MRAVAVEQLQHRPGGYPVVRPFLHHAYLWIAVQHLCGARGRRVPVHGGLRGGGGQRFRRRVRIVYHSSEGVCVRPSYWGAAHAHAYICMCVDACFDACSSPFSNVERSDKRGLQLYRFLLERNIGLLI